MRKMSVLEMIPSRLRMAPTAELDEPSGIVTLTSLPGAPDGFSWRWNHTNPPPSSTTNATTATRIARTTRGIRGTLPRAAGVELTLENHGGCHLVDRSLARLAAHAAFDQRPLCGHGAQALVPEHDRHCKHVAQLFGLTPNRLGRRGLLAAE